MHAAAGLLAALACTPLGVARADGQWQGRISASDGFAGDLFGHDVAIDRDWLVVGAPEANGSQNGSGAVYVFQRQGSTWAQQGKLTAPDGASGDRFGGSVSIDGDTIVVGAWDSDVAGEGSGSAYVYNWDGGAWAQRAQLAPDDGDSGDSFGWSVAVSGDAIAVGAYSDEDDGASSGAVYMFRREGDAWGQHVKLTASDARASQYFGSSVSLDGENLAVGAHGDDDRGRNAGAAYVFSWNGAAWAEVAKCVGGDVVTGDRFGSAVSVSGNRLVASAPGRIPSGVAYVFGFDGASWAEQAKLAVAGAIESDAVACDVAIDGADVVIGARGDDAAGSDAGAAYVFTCDGETWLPSAKLTAAGFAGGGLGASVAADGGLVVAGAVADGAAAGSAHVFYSGTRTAWRAGADPAGDWFEPNNWTAGVPAAATDVAIEGGVAAEIRSAAATAGAVSVGAAAAGALRIDDGELAADSLLAGPAGLLSVSASGTLRLQDGLATMASDPGDFDLSGAAVHFTAPAVSGTRGLLEAAGRDLGLAGAGWQENFAIGSLVVEAGAILRLVDEFDNDANGGGPEAVYVGELTVEPGGRIDLDSLNLYYLNGGVPKRLISGDTDLDGDTDRGDFATLREHFGMAVSAGWLDGDSDGDGDVDVADYLAMKRGLGLVARGDGVEIPEPTALSLLALGPALLAARTRRGRRSE